MGETYELVRKRVEEVVDVKENWFENKEDAEKFYFRMKKIPSKEDFNRLYYVRKRKTNTEQ